MRRKAADILFQNSVDLQRYIRIVEGMKLDIPPMGVASVGMYGLPALIQGSLQKGYSSLRRGNRDTLRGHLATLAASALIWYDYLESGESHRNT